MEFLLEIVELLLHFSIEGICQKFSYNRKTKKESTIFFVFITAICLAAIVGFVALFLWAEGYGLKTVAVLGTGTALLCAVMNYIRFRHRMK